MTDKQAPASAMPPKVRWEYEGDGLCLFWDNPWSGEKEKIATFWWPAHPPEATEAAEAMFETIASRACLTGGALEYALSTARKEARAECAEMLEKAYRFLREGKAKFAPDTTNSRVDEWLADYEAQQARAGEGK